MEVLYPRCAGLDVHAGSVTACVRIATGAAVAADLADPLFPRSREIAEFLNRCWWHETAAN